MTARHAGRGAIEDGRGGGHRGRRAGAAVPVRGLPAAATYTSGAAHATGTAALSAAAHGPEAGQRLRIVPYRAAHLDNLLLQPAQAYLQPLFKPDYASALESAGAFTACVGERVIGCGGVHTLHPRRGLAWALVAHDAGAHFVAIHRAVVRRLADSPLARIEAHVDRDFAAAQRWMRLLGFVNETPGGMRAFTPDGRSCDLYARVREPSATIPTSTHS